MTTLTLISERGKTHGDFTDNSKVAQQIKAAIDESPAKLTYVQAEALDFIASKIGRICSGNANEPDHWRDIAGYATLAADRIQPEHPELPLQSAPEIEEGLYRHNWHHPDKSVPGPGDGYRFLLKGEHPPDDTELWQGNSWSPRSSINKGTPMCLASTYRTKAPLPNV